MMNNGKNWYLKKQNFRLKLTIFDPSKNSKITVCNEKCNKTCCDTFLQLSLGHLAQVSMSFKVWPGPIWIKVNICWQILPQHQSTYLRGRESASIEIPLFRSYFIKLSKTVSYTVNLTSQRSHLDILFQSIFWSNKGNFNWCRF